MERELLEKGPVLDREGRPMPGFSRRSILTYDRKAIGAPPWRIKEWDFYQISNDRLCLQMTIGHAAYAGLVSLNLFDFRRGKRYLQASHILPLPFGSLHMPADAEEDHSLVYTHRGMPNRYHNGNIFMSFTVSGGRRVLTCRWKDLEAYIVLERRNPDSLVVNLPFDEYEHAFYYNHKINCMTAEGYVRTHRHLWEFDRKDSFGILDWGRGVWPFHNEWYWSNGSGWLDGELFGFNLGCGFGNTDMATENMLFYQGKSHKIGKVDFILGEDHGKPWHFRDREGRLDLCLTPAYDNLTRTKLLWVDNRCHQVFGRFSGTAVLDDGKVLQVRDVISFAEHAVNNW